MNLIELGYEPESEYCGKCDMLNTEWKTCPLEQDKNIKQIWDEEELKAYTFTEEELTDFYCLYLRCQPCKNSEQAAKQMIPESKIKVALYHAGEIAIKLNEVDPLGYAGAMKVAKLFEELLNQTKEPLQPETRVWKKALEDGYESPPE